MMRTLFVLLAFVAVSCVNAAAQAESALTKPQMVDSFGSVAYSDMLARLDNFATELQNAPQTKGFVVAYPQPNNLPGWTLKRANWARAYLVKGRGLDVNRVNVVNGGFSNAVKYELWIVPPGAELPVPPFDLAAALVREKSPYLFDKVVFENAPPPPEAAADDETPLDEKDAYEPFMTTLKSDPAARGLIIAYATRRNRHGTDRKIAAHEKLNIMKFYPIAPDRIVAVGGGLRVNRTIEFWIVPPGAELPKPTPTVRTVRRKRR
jgi:hypothetical protein